VETSKLKLVEIGENMVLGPLLQKQISIFILKIKLGFGLVLINLDQNQRLLVN
jgi:hypothetical protein